MLMTGARLTFKRLGASPSSPEPMVILKVYDDTYCICLEAYEPSFRSVVITKYSHLICLDYYIGYRSSCLGRNVICPT